VEFDKANRIFNHSRATSRDWRNLPTAISKKIKFSWMRNSVKSVVVTHMTVAIKPFFSVSFQC